MKEAQKTLDKALDIEADENTQSGPDYNLMSSHTFPLLFSHFLITYTYYLTLEFNY